MRYVSTRGKAPELGFEDVLLTGLARDGGLYLPQDWPQFSQPEIARMAGRSYEAVALEVMRPFLDGEVSDHELRAIIAEAYGTVGHGVENIDPLVAPSAKAMVGKFDEVVRTKTPVTTTSSLAKSSFSQRRR